MRERKIRKFHAEEYASLGSVTCHMLGRIATIEWSTSRHNDESGQLLRIHNGRHRRRLNAVTRECTSEDVKQPNRKEKGAVHSRAIHKREGRFDITETPPGGGNDHIHSS